MRITWDELTVSPYDLDLDGLLADWRWLVGEGLRPVVIGALGDLFLLDESGRVHRLDVGFGRLTVVAASAEEFQALMIQPEHADGWFSPQLVGDILESGGRLGPRQCFSWKVPPALGGEFSPDNFEPTDLHVHFSVLGQLHRQIKDLPPGASIDEIIVK